MDSMLTTLEDALRDCPVGPDGALELSDEYLMMVLGGGDGSTAAPPPPPPPPPPDDEDSLPDHIGHITTFTEAGAAAGAGTGFLLGGPGGAAAGGALGGFVGFALGVGYEIHEHASDAIWTYRDNPPPI